MPSESVTRETIQQAAGAVIDPELGRSLAELQMIGEIDLSSDKAHIAIRLPTPAYPEVERLADAVRTAVSRATSPGTAVDVQIVARTRGKQSGGNIGLRVQNVIAVGSGKGGVGKSTIAASLAYGLQHFGATVGLMDADVYGPSIPHLVGVEGNPAIKEYPTPDGRTVERMVPHDAGGVKVMSMGFMVPAEQAVIWRGPMLHKALMQFLAQTDWGELDYLIIDMPPGTGDVALTLSQAVGLAGAVVVCTPQQVALLDAVKAIGMFRQVKIPVLGIVENMSGDIFGRGGARAKASEMGVPFLGEVPAIAAVREKGDAGRIADVYAPDSAAAPHLLHVCQRTAIEVARHVIDQPAMPQLEIL
ncbi:MAG: Mrp/NBP35 family ATP-binding protein [Planctomycetaceae bacterium]|nr:Mrp/NBP35 family ATP-binding protein [Planctomycetaceae bacterium]